MVRRLQLSYTSIYGKQNRKILAPKLFSGVFLLPFRRNVHASKMYMPPLFKFPVCQLLKC